jgi:hypothetical protein
MRRYQLMLAPFALLAVTALCAAQAPGYYGPYPPGSYPRDPRAYRHFLNSPSPVKSYSSLQPGRAWGYDTPFESGRFYRTPGYYRELVSPRGYERVLVPPEVGGLIERRPVYLPPPYPAYPPYHYR